MSPKRLIVVFGITILLVIAGAALWTVTHPAGQKQNHPVINNTGTPGVTPSPAPTGTPEPTAATPDGSDALADTSAQEKALRTMITGFLTFDRNEAASARTARLTPLVAPGSGIIGTIPSIAREDQWGLVGFNAVTIVTSVDVVSVDSETPDGHGYVMSALVSYVAKYSLPGQTQAVNGQKIWTITVPKTGSPLPVTITQPGG
jgi:hypothetical protein